MKLSFKFVIPVTNLKLRFWLILQTEVVNKEYFAHSNFRHNNH